VLQFSLKTKFLPPLQSRSITVKTKENKRYRLISGDILKNQSFSTVNILFLTLTDLDYLFAAFYNIVKVKEGQNQKGELT